MKHSSSFRLSVLGRVPDSASGTSTPKYKEVTQNKEAVETEGIRIIRLEECIYFTNIGNLKYALHRIEMYGDATAHPSEPRSRPLVRGIILNLKNVPTMDSSALESLVELVDKYKRQRVQVGLVKIRRVFKEKMLRSGMPISVFDNSIHDSVLRLTRVSNVNDEQSGV
ncbi:hypothetical protein SAMD00019534_073670 [Acytostelium subglobosum LB1]|uniref:hypothetical protein n=1 Tax=Acytostelium subglobosum LB1 TaxID=1410327 RepID=UPI000644811B|nr:hypothetical protein SAMD00019534_073670 [Acytostelium subglobosum LB1]GAM24192.1 hypothetical protein SAMD00019534_073670 [Acytostelium subglobosum LB1]|eukprot:XP_012752518.1 hypothetical protein SAMD00019534_073670 [Acytostelium subglobosum LB1]